VNLNRLSFRLPALVACLLLAPGAKSQEPAKPRRHFEVASIKAAVAGPVLVNPLTYFPGGRFTATNVTLVDVIVRVYPTRRIQMQGGPSWIDSERFDIVAKADAADGEVKDAEWHEMVQSLLEDRFQLSFHRETKEMPVLALALGKDPPRLKPAKDDEQTVVKMGEHGDLIFQKMPMGGLVNTLSNIIHQPVVDKTGWKASSTSQSIPTPSIFRPPLAPAWRDLCGQSAGGHRRPTRVQDRAPKNASRNHHH